MRFGLFFILLNASFNHVLAAEPSKAGSSFPHDYISCSMLTVEQLTLLQLAQRGLTRTQALEELPFTRKKGMERTKEVYDLIEREGILDAYSLINSNYARCAKLVFEDRGKPAPDLKEYGFYFCAGENKLRYEIILRINQSFDLDRVLAETDDSRFDVAISYFNLIEKKGLLAAFDYTANNLKACISRIE